VISGAKLTHCLISHSVLGRDIESIRRRSPTRGLKDAGRRGPGRAAPHACEYQSTRMLDKLECGSYWGLQVCSQLTLSKSLSFDAIVLTPSLFIIAR